MLNWIALEILWGASGVSVETPYVGPNCRHQISQCPTCEKPTTRKTLGASVRHYLHDVCGVDEETARKLWKVRRMFHGAVGFDDGEMGALTGLIQVLRSVVVDQLKQATGAANTEPPLVSAGNPSVDPETARGGYRVVMKKDLQ